MIRVRKIILSGLSLLLSSLIIFSLVYIYFAIQLPSINGLKKYQMQMPMQIMTTSGQLIESFGEKHRFPLQYHEIPQQLIQAILATEDQNFFHHGGVDILGLVRATKVLLMTGKKREGASTITMQVARNFFLSKKKTYHRKISEILLAIKIDQVLTKEEILTLYLNKIFFGQRAYGIEAAARVYYGKSVNALNLPQIAMLAGLPQAPSRNPMAHPQGAIKRRNHVLYRMFKAGYIDRNHYENAIHAPITAKKHELQSAIKAPHVAELVRQVMLQHFGIHAYTQGYKVYTTIESNNQTHAVASLQKGLMAYDRQYDYRHLTENLQERFGEVTDQWQRYMQSIPIVANLTPAAVIAISPFDIQVLLPNGRTPILDRDKMQWAAKHEGSHFNLNDYFDQGDLIFLAPNEQGQWHLAQYPEIEGALVDLNPTTGAIQSLVGGFDYHVSHFDRATQAMRQAGSILKPFIYMAGLEKGLTLATIINDAPIIKKDSGINATWRPHNVSHHFYGPTRLRIGLIRSRNIVSVRLLERIGIHDARAFMARFGFDMSHQPRALSLALGAGVVSPLQMAQGYAAIANGGMRVHPYLIDHVEDAQGHTLLKGPLLPLDQPKPYALMPKDKDYFQPKRAINARASWIPIRSSNRTETIFLDRMRPIRNRVGP